MPSLPQVRLKGKRKAQVRAVPLASDGPRERAVEAALDRLRPAVREDGGDVELVSVTPGAAANGGDLVTIRFLGACVGCPSSQMTLRDGIERHLVSEVAGVGGVVATED